MDGKKIFWMTDIHLNFLNSNKLEKFIASLQEKSPDAVLISGDIADAPSVSGYLQGLEQNLEADIYFVLGNHDFYNGSFFQVRKEICEISAKSEKLFFLDNIPYIGLTEGIGLVGHSSWADGRFGDYWSSQLMLNDYLLIKEFKELDKVQRLQRLKKLGDDAALKLREKIESAFEHYNKLLCLTHPPPFKEACQHKGKIADDNYLPHFACKAVGDAIKQIMESCPDFQLVILCGHTHSYSRVKILENLEVITGDAEYGHPKARSIIGF